MKNKLIVSFLTLVIAGVSYCILLDFSTAQQKFNKESNTKDLKLKTSKDNKVKTDSETKTIEIIYENKKEKQESLEYFMYRMNEHCEWFFRSDVDSLESLNRVMENNQTQAFYTDKSYRREMEEKLEYCLDFLRIESYRRLEAQQKLVGAALEKSDPNAIALKAFNSLYLEKKSSEFSARLLIPALEKNNPNAIFVLAQIVSSHSLSENKTLLENALRIISCEYGAMNCGGDAALVRTTCETAQVCGGNLAETIIMSVPIEHQNEFNLILENLRNTAETKSWAEFIERNITSSEQ